MKCPICGGPTKVVDSRPLRGTTWRRRECLSFGHRFNTLEVEQAELAELKNAKIASFNPVFAKQPQKSQK